MLEVFLRAIPLALRKDAEHQIDLTVQRRKFASNLHDNILLELLTIDQVSCGLLEQILSADTLKRHNVNLDL